MVSGGAKENQYSHFVPLELNNYRNPDVRDHVIFFDKIAQLDRMGGEFGKQFLKDLNVDEKTPIEVKSTFKNEDIL